jgi:hypothetical protein
MLKGYDVVYLNAVHKHACQGSCHALLNIPFFACNSCANKKTVDLSVITSKELIAVRGTDL